MGRRLRCARQLSCAALALAVAACRGPVAAPGVPPAAVEAEHVAGVAPESAPADPPADPATRPAPKAPPPDPARPSACTRDAAHPDAPIALNPWRAAVDGYVSSVAGRRQIPFGGAAAAFAAYVNAMHDRIHPGFADRFLASLDKLPSTHPLNNILKVSTRVEVVLGRDGHIARLGIVKSSGVTAFDVVALDAVDCAQPFGPVPAAIVSADGYVYVHWEFRRDAAIACSTMNTRPYLFASDP
jgi:TonB family protein